MEPLFSSPVLCRRPISVGSASATAARSASEPFVGSSRPATPGSRTEPLRPRLRNHGQSQGQASAGHLMVDQINRDTDLYAILGLKSLARQAVRLDDIRRAYITRSRICHPDKLPDYPGCTPAFQKLSFAYETLSKPASRRLYDLSRRPKRPASSRHHSSASYAHPPCYSHHHSNQPTNPAFENSPPSSPSQNPRNTSSGRPPHTSARHRADDDHSKSSSDHTHPHAGLNPDETLNGVLYSTFCEFMDGDFEMIRVLINALNEGNPGLNLGEESIETLENSFRKLRSLLLIGSKYLKSVKFELMNLYELQSDLRQLSYFNLLGRFRLSLAIVRVSLTIPLRIHEVSKQQQQDENDENDEEQVDLSQKWGILPSPIAGLLGATVAALEKGEKATNWISPPTSSLDQDHNSPPSTDRVATSA